MQARRSLPILVFYLLLLDAGVRAPQLEPDATQLEATREIRSQEGARFDVRRVSAPNSLATSRARIG